MLKLFTTLFEPERVAKRPTTFRILEQRQNRVIELIDIARQDNNYVKVSQGYTILKAINERQGIVYGSNYNNLINS